VYIEDCGAIGFESCVTYKRLYMQMCNSTQYSDTVTGVAMGDG